MAFKRYVGGIIRGTAAERATVPADEPIGTLYLELETNKMYLYAGESVWNEHLSSADPNSVQTFTNKTMSNDSNTFQYVGAYNAIIYKSGSTYKAKKGDGTSLGSSTSLDAVVQAALNVKGLIFWVGSSDGSAYIPSGSFTGWNVSNDTTLIIAKGNNITLPQGQTGPVFNIDDTFGGDHKTFGITIQGGTFVEGGSSPTALWTLIKLKSGSSTAGNAGVYNNTFRDIYVKRCQHMINLQSNTGLESWVNGNRFDSLWCDYPKVGILFQQGGVINASKQAINRNSFTNIVIQADPAYTTESLAMTHGVKDIAGVNNSFKDVKIWDTKAPNTSCNITSKARDTILDSSLMTQQPVDWKMSQDFGLRTRLVGDPNYVSNNSGISNPMITQAGTFYGWSGAGTTEIRSLGDGLLNVLTVAGTITHPAATADGTPKRAATGTTINTVAGIRGATTATCRNFNPYYAIKFKINSVVMNDQKVFFGFLDTTTPSLATADDPGVNFSCFGLYHSTSHGTSGTNWMMVRNTGTASSTFTDTGVAANNTNTVTLYVALWQTTTAPKGQWRIGDVTTQIGEATSTIPGQFTGMVPGLWISNSAAADKRVDVFWMYLQNLNPEGGVTGAD